MDKSAKAVALKYDQKNDRAPRIIAKGRGNVAEKIIDVARENNVPLYEDKNLIQILEALELETEIPPELYRAVAEVLVENHPVPMKRIGVRDTFAESGPYLDLLDKYKAAADAGLELAARLAELPPSTTITSVPGRNPDAYMIEVADTVTEMRKIKHAFDAGLSAKKGLDF